MGVGVKYVDREKVYFQCHTNLNKIKFLCPVQNKPVRKGNTMWVSFIIWIFIAIEWKGSENSHNIDIILHYCS